MSSPRVLPVGDAAVTVELGTGLDPATNAACEPSTGPSPRAPFEGFREAVPTHRSLLVLFEPAAARYGRGRAPAPRAGERTRVALAARAAPRGSRSSTAARTGPTSPRSPPSAASPRATWSASTRGSEYTAFMLGFMPGFAYLGLLPEALECRRRATPRVRVPAGSVALAGRQTGVYPVASPGGWQLVGRTSLRFFDPFRDEPALLAPGDRVRFVSGRGAAAARAGDGAARRPAAARSSRSWTPASSPRCRTPAARATAASGSAAPAPWTRAPTRRANRAVGNPPGAAALECTVAGPALAFLAPVRFAVAGADLGAVLERADLGAWPVPSGSAVLARPGNVLRFAGRRSGCRAYVALAGGIDVPAVLGSRSTDLPSAFGGVLGRALATGDRLGVARAAGGPETARRRAARSPRARRVRVVLGPQADHFDAETIARFLASSWRVGATSDRVGCRLEGEPLRHLGPAEILSDGMVPGSIQVPPDGQPIVMAADGPTTGGYPKIATVLTADLPLLAQLVPGEGEVRFEAVPIESL